MNVKVFGTALALICAIPIIGSAPAHARDHMKYGAYAMNKDSCPYYPSPVLCRSHARSVTTGSAPANHMTIGTRARDQAPADVEENDYM